MGDGILRGVGATYIRGTKRQGCSCAGPYLVLAVDDGSDSVGSTGRKGAGLGLKGPKLGRCLEFEKGEGGVVYLVQKFFPFCKIIILVLLNQNTVTVTLNSVQNDLRSRPKPYSSSALSPPKVCQNMTREITTTTDVSNTRELRSGMHLS